MSSRPESNRPIGGLLAGLAFVWWGLFPLYFRIVGSVPAAQVLAHRIVWCLVFLMIVMTVRRQWAWLPAALSRPRVLGAFAASALAIAGNWLLYIWSINHNQVVDASLGYFITPLVNVLFGVTLLSERLRRMQWAALAMAGLGVAWLTWNAGHLPWIALGLAATFGSYGLLRKVGTLGALEGLVLETLLLAPIALAALGFWTWQGGAGIGDASLGTRLWLIGFGPITALPLLMFAAGARRLSMTALGLFQYIAPTIQFIVGLWAFDESFSVSQMIGFGLIWAALAAYSAEGWAILRGSNGNSRCCRFRNPNHRCPLERFQERLFNRSGAKRLSRSRCLAFSLSAVVVSSASGADQAATGSGAVLRIK